MFIYQYLFIYLSFIIHLNDFFSRYLRKELLLSFVCLSFYMYLRSRFPEIRISFKLGMKKTNKQEKKHEISLLILLYQYLHVNKYNIYFIRSSCYSTTEILFI